MRDFVAIDFETANNEPSSICSVGIVVVRDGVVQHRQHRLVRPVRLELRSVRTSLRWLPAMRC